MQQISNSQYLQRKAVLLLKATDPNQVQEALQVLGRGKQVVIADTCSLTLVAQPCDQGLAQSITAVLIVVRMRMGRVLALGVQLGAKLEKVAILHLQPPLVCGSACTESDF